MHGQRYTDWEVYERAEAAEQYRRDREEKEEKCREVTDGELEDMVNATTTEDKDGEGK